MNRLFKLKKLILGTMTIKDFDKKTIDLIVNNIPPKRATVRSKEHKIMLIDSSIGIP